MEKALHITNLKNLKYFTKDKYQRLYWGAEFCQNLIPILADSEKIFKFAWENNLKVTLVTPFVTERGLKKLKEMFCWLKAKKTIYDEVVVNDWGVLECLRKEFSGCFALSLGRLLTRQQRDPTMKKLLEKQLPFAVRRKDGKICIVVHRPPDKLYQEGIRASYINSHITQDFLSGLGIRRVELNNLIQGLRIEEVGFKKSLYTPYVNISTTRFCPMESSRQKIYRINVCHKECQRYYDILRSRAVPLRIYKRGNTTFYKNSASLSNAERLGVDRLVFQPELPF